MSVAAKRRGVATGGGDIAGSVSEKPAAHASEQPSTKNTRGIWQEGDLSRHGDHCIAAARER